MINRVVLVGRLTRDPDLRYTQGGTAVATFTVAVDRNFTNASGEREADFISCVLWRKAAESFANYTHKGSLVGVEGRLQTRNYENNQGQRVYVTEVVVDNFSFLEPKSSQPNQGSNNNFNNSNSGGNGAGNNNQANNQPQNNNQNDPFADNGQQIDISDDDLPF